MQKYMILCKSRDNRLKDLYYVGDFKILEPIDFKTPDSRAKIVKFNSKKDAEKTLSTIIKNSHLIGYSKPQIASIENIPEIYVPEIKEEDKFLISSVYEEDENIQYTKLMRKINDLSSQNSGRKPLTTTLSKEDKKIIEERKNIAKNALNLTKQATSYVLYKNLVKNIKYKDKIREISKEMELQINTLITNLEKDICGKYGVDIRDYAFYDFLKYILPKTDRLLLNKYRNIIRNKYPTPSIPHVSFEDLITEKDLKDPLIQEYCSANRGLVAKIQSSRMKEEYVRNRPEHVRRPYSCNFDKKMPKYYNKRDTLGRFSKKEVVIKDTNGNILKVINYKD